MRFSIYRHPDLTLAIYEKNISHFRRENVEAEDVCERNRGILSHQYQQVFDAIFPSQTFFTGTSKNTGKPCIQPVDSRHSCYAGTQAIRVEFENPEDCSSHNQFKKCPSYFSVCIRR